MKNHFFRLVFNCPSLIVIFTACCYADEIATSVEKQDKSTLIQKATAGDVSAVRALGKTKDATLIPILTRQINEARSTKANPVYIRALRTSLASSGDSGSQKDIIQEIESKDRYIQHNAFEDAAEVGGNEMIVKIAEKLFDKSPGGRPVDQEGNLVTDEALPAPRHAAVVALSRVVDDPEAPKINLKRITYQDEDVLKWQAWWETNKVKYQPTAPPPTK